VVGCGRIPLFAALAIMPIMVAACSATVEPEISRDVTMKKGGLAAVAATEVSLNESDQRTLKQADLACKNRDFMSFFAAALRSHSVRRRYFTSPIKTAKGDQLVDSYSFPFQLVDTYYVSTDSLGRGPADWGNVILNVDQARGNRVRIDYGPGGNDPGLDDGGAQLLNDKEYGPRGYLLFFPAKDCWTPVEEGVQG
jgi:hypothetical protein